MSCTFPARISSAASAISETTSIKLARISRGAAALRPSYHPFSCARACTPTCHSLTVASIRMLPFHQNKALPIINPTINHPQREINVATRCRVRGAETAKRHRINPLPTRAWPDAVLLRIFHARPGPCETTNQLTGYPHLISHLAQSSAPCTHLHGRFILLTVTGPNRPHAARVCAIFHRAIGPPTIPSGVSFVGSVRVSETAFRLARPLAVIARRPRTLQ